tara:strand:- start:5458 stop:5931 length:474 start_codon:yes stop_codon:yes gene_type:complete
MIQNCEHDPDIVAKAFKKLILVERTPLLEKAGTEKFFLMQNGSLLTFLDRMHADAVESLETSCYDELECFCAMTGALRMVISHFMKQATVNIMLQLFCLPSPRQAERLNELIIQYRAQQTQVRVYFEADDASEEWDGEVNTIYDVPAFMHLKCPRYS